MKRRLEVGTQWVRLGEVQGHSFQLSFDTSLNVNFQGFRVTSEGVLIAVSALAQQLGARSIDRTTFD